MMKIHVSVYACDSVNVILFLLLVNAHAKVSRTDQDDIRVKQVQTEHVQQKKESMGIKYVGTTPSHVCRFPTAYQISSTLFNIHYHQ